MPSPRIEYAVLPAGEGRGQDRCFTADGLVVVLDGASAIDPVANPDATEYVDTLGPLVIEQITGTPGIDLRDALAEAIRQTTAQLVLIPGTAPSSTVSVVRWGAETVDILVLGDSPVIVQFTDGCQETIVQHSQDHIAPELRRLYRERLLAGHGYDDDHRAILARIQREEASCRNRDGGYWIAETDDRSPKEASLRVVQTDLVGFVLAATDGAKDTAEYLELPFTPLARASSAGLYEILEQLAEWEAKVDFAGGLLPRSKRHDDKTFAVLASDLYLS